jgi:hypothetical protein
LTYSQPSRKGTDTSITTNLIPSPLQIFAGNPFFPFHKGILSESIKYLDKILIAFIIPDCQQLTDNVKEDEWD